jgi:hypothetical protein
LSEKFSSFSTVKPDKKRIKAHQEDGQANLKVDWYFQIDRENIYLIPEVSGISVALEPSVPAGVSRWRPNLLPTIPSKTFCRGW